MNDFGECTGCTQEERGGMQYDTKQQVGSMTGVSLSNVPTHKDVIQPFQGVVLPQNVNADRRAWLSGRRAFLA
jgi:hypothetical protein